MDATEKTDVVVGTLFSEADPYSVINSVNAHLKNALLSVPKYVWQQTEKELRAPMRLSSVDIALRVSFWREYTRRCEGLRERPKEHHALVAGVQIFTGICSEPYFYQHFLRKPLKCGWMFTPLPTWRSRMEVLLWRFVDRLEEIAEMQLIDPATGKVVGTNLKVFLDAYKHVEDRVVGVKTRKLVTKNLNLNKDLDEQEPVEIEEVVVEEVPKTPEEIEAEIAELEGRSEKGNIEGQADDDKPVSDIQPDEQREDSDKSELRSGDDIERGTDDACVQEETYLTTVPS